MARSIRRALFTASGALAALGLFVAFESTGASGESRGSRIIDGSAEKHYVTPSQWSAAGRRSREPVEPFEGDDHFGRRVRWPDDFAGRPVVLVFVKRDCPCNVEFEPYFQRLAAAHPGVRFLGVLDGDRRAAAAYAGANQVAYPVLADAERTIVAKIGAENGAYVALLAPDGTLGALWPGCSRQMMDEMNRRLAELTRLPVPAIDWSGLPSALTTGCPFGG